jgi:hypothetical protein
MSHCKYELDLSAEELMGVTWLIETLGAIAKKGPSHRSFHRAQNAMSALATMKIYCNTVHVSAHALIEELVKSKEDIKLLETRVASLEAALTSGEEPPDEPTES